MYKNIKNIIRFFFILLFFPSFILAVPMQINYQGYLTDDNNIPINDTVKITFKIYDKIEGGDFLWSEIHEYVLVENGIYQVILGSLRNLTPELFNDERYIGLSIRDDIELKPRQKITSVVFSIKAQEAETVSDGAVTEKKIADGAVTTSKIANNAITSNKIQDGSGSGLNADLLDGKDSSHFALKEECTQKEQGNGTVIQAIAGETLKGAETPVPVYINKEGLILEQIFGNSKADVYGTNKYAQIIVTDVGTKEIKKLTLKLEKAGTPSGNFEVSIHLLGENNSPTTVHIDKSKVSIIANDVLNGWNDFIFEDSVQVSSSIEYAIVVSLPDGDANNHIKWLYSTSDIYKPGNGSESKDFGFNWTAIDTNDFVFKLYSDNRVYACDASNNDKIDFIGFAVSNADKGEAIKIQTNGTVTGFKELKPGMKYYLQNIPGLIGPVPGKISKLIAISLNKTDIMIFWSDSVNISSLDEAIAGEDDTKMMTPFKTNEAILANKPVLYIGKLANIRKVLKESQSWSEEIKMGFKPTYFKAIVYLYYNRTGCSDNTCTSVATYLLEDFSNGQITKMGFDIWQPNYACNNPFAYYEKGILKTPDYIICNISSLEIRAGTFRLNSIHRTDKGLIFNFIYQKNEKYADDVIINYRIDNIIAW